MRLLILLAAAASADQFDLRKLEIHRDGDRLRGGAMGGAGECR